jgi:hypothetical protein
MRSAEAWGRSQSLPDGEFGEFLGRLALIPETLEDGIIVLPKDAGSLLIDVEAHDYGGNLSMPTFNLERPAKDYYASNLSIYMFVICNITRGENRILLYDERAQGKGCEALCNLRFKSSWDAYKIRFANNLPALQLKPLKYLLMDNCVGQNKSQVVFKNYCLLSLLFYTKVVVHFNHSGHTHLINDVTVAHAKTALKKQNVYHPSVVAELMNSVSDVSVEFIDHNDEECYFKTGWESLLDDHMPDLKATMIVGGYTSCHFFEFTNGVVNIMRNGGERRGHLSN